MASLPSSATTFTFTHLLALLAGVVIGKSIDADELGAYRSSESIFASMRRRLKSTIVVGLVLGLVVKVGKRAIMGGGEKTETKATE